MSQNGAGDPKKSLKWDPDESCHPVLRSSSSVDQHICYQCAWKEKVVTLITEARNQNLEA